MPYNPVFHTPSKSLADRLYNAEFDDAIIEQHYWKNPRYDGCKVKSREINKYTPKINVPSSQTGIGFASIVTVGAGIGLMAIGSPGQSAFTVGGPFANILTQQTPVTNLPGIFKVGNFIPNIIWEGDTIGPQGLNPNMKKETTKVEFAEDNSNLKLEYGI